jgi:hypothetical protein
MVEYWLNMSETLDQLPAPPPTTKNQPLACKIKPFNLNDPIRR